MRQPEVGSDWPRIFSYRIGPLMDRATTISGTNWSAPESSGTPPPPSAGYAAIASPAHRKKLGQFFTPPNVASLMADWVMAREPAVVLDPALGTGVLTRACIERNSEARYLAYEKDSLILGYVDRRVRDLAEIVHGDFLESTLPGGIDAVIMNPPYIRHREIEGYEIERSAISAATLCEIPRSANLYIYFTLKALGAIRQNGRAAILIPGEWMSANFAVNFKRHLINTGVLKELVLFSNCSNVFDDALTTASILLCEK